MKKILFLFVAATLLAACGQTTETTTTDSTSVDSVKVDSITTTVDTVKVDSTVVKAKADSLKK